jgi:hypothetical protein
VKDDIGDQGLKSLDLMRLLTNTNILDVNY